MALAPGSIIAWLVVGLVAGWTAGKVSRGHAFGLIGDLAVGLIGALVGGLIAGVVIPESASLVWDMIVAFAGAVALLALIRLVGGRRLAA